MFSFCSSIKISLTHSSNRLFGSAAGDAERGAATSGAFQVTGIFGRAAAETAMAAHPEIRKNFQTTLRDLVGPEFTSHEFRILEDRALDAVELRDLNTLRGIYVGVPVDITRAQKSTIDRLMRQLGSDDLGERARATYQEGLKNGKIRVR